MHKNWAAMLSMIGLAGSAVRVQSQVVNGSANANPGTTTEQGKNNQKVSTAQKTDKAGKLSVNQQTLRQQNQVSNGGKTADTMTPSAYCNKGNNQQVTKGGNQQVTKGNQQVTKGSPNAQVTKGSAHNQITKGNQQVTKGSANAQVTKGSANAQVTKGSANTQVTKGTANRQVTKGSAVQTTAAATPK
jgi:hypothetical protein